jgi:phosphotransferase system enzyme I (PtsI)
MLDLENLLSEVDFASIGTNDLLQYVFAIDRSNENVNYKDLVYEPVFLKLLKHAGKIRLANPKKSMSVCGEIAGNPLVVPFIVGAGIHELSMPPKFIPEIKKVLGAFTTKECSSLLEKAIKMSGRSEVLSLITNEFKRRKLSALIT